jgi:hypothetical protein
MKADNKESNKEQEIEEEQKELVGHKGRKKKRNI